MKKYEFQVSRIVQCTALIYFLAATANFACAASVNEPAAMSAAPVRGPLDSGVLGLFAASDFRLINGRCQDCSTIKQALWYFQDELIAVPHDGIAPAGYAPGVSAIDDVRQAAPSLDTAARPPLIWIGSSKIIDGAVLAGADNSVRLQDGTLMDFFLTPKLATNHSYYDAHSADFFRGKSLRIRGELRKDPGARPVLVARTIWPKDYVIDRSQLKPTPLAANETLASLVKKDSQDYSVRLLWQRNPAAPRDWNNLAVLGLMLNGAQGDDDEAHGGHFGVVTGRYNAQGEMADWLVNNFYNLDAYSEKGIVASTVPLDNYLADLNSGQSYYRPSYMLIALLRRDTAAAAYQAGIERVYNHFYRHDFVYDHAGDNCSGISIDAARALGWEIPQSGPTSYLKAIAAYPYMAVKDRSLQSGKDAFDYLTEERSRLFPEIAFEAMGNDLMRLAGVKPLQRKATHFEETLSDDIEALIFVRIPQIPSSRAMGTYPISSIDEYQKRVPEDKSQWKIIPVEPRPFPQEFANVASPQTGNRGRNFLLGAGLVAGGAVGIMAGVRRRKDRKSVV